MPSPIITLTTDFGTDDWFVGTMKGVILNRCPDATLVDITHGIPPGDIRAGAFALAAAAPYFPAGTIHMVVVDPGVGSERRAIAIQTDTALFIAPDNGVVSLAVGAHSIKTIRRIENSKYWLKPLSRTFHGRDVFASVAGHLAAGASLATIGPRMADFEQIQMPAIQEDKCGVRGEVIFIDHFGNAITNIPEGGETSGAVFLHGKKLCGVMNAYSAVAKGKPVAVFGSTGFLEISINGGNAARKLRLTAGSPVRFQW